MRDNQVVHCDLKPENILLCKENKSGIKVVDLGSGTLEKDQYYTYIQSRYYRAPEVILGIRYSPAIDVWSLGCILYELYSGRPLFTGEDELDQLACIAEVRGPAPRSLVVVASRRKLFFDDDYLPLASSKARGFPGSKPIQ